VGELSIIAFLYLARPVVR